MELAIALTASESRRVVCLVAQSASGQVFAIRDVAVGSYVGTYYSRGYSTCHGAGTGASNGWATSW